MLTMKQLSKVYQTHMIETHALRGIDMAVREGEFVATAKIYWYDAADSFACMEWTQRVKSALRPFTLEGKATYINYIENPFDGWQESYYGRSYPRLRRVKSKVDPGNFFGFPMGSEPY